MQVDLASHLVPGLAWASVGTLAPQRAAALLGTLLAPGRLRPFLTAGLCTSASNSQLQGSGMLTPCVALNGALPAQQKGKWCFHRSDYVRGAALGGAGGRRARAQLVR